MKLAPPSSAAAKAVVETRLARHLVGSHHHRHRRQPHHPRRSYHYRTGQQRIHQSHQSGWSCFRSWVENLTLESTLTPPTPKTKTISWCAITMENTADSWVRQVTFKHFAGSLWHSTKPPTHHRAGLYFARARFRDRRLPSPHIFTMGQQTLSSAAMPRYGRHDFSVGHCAAGPNAFVNAKRVKLSTTAARSAGPVASSTTT